ARDRAADCKRHLYLVAGADSANARSAGYPALEATVSGCFQRSDVELHHLQHGFRSALHAERIWVHHELAQPARHDLPAKAPAVPHPTALLDRSALAQGAPQTVDLLLAVAFHHDREAVVEWVKRSRLDRHVVLVAAGEARDLHASGRSARTFCLQRRSPADRRTGNERRIEPQGCVHVLLEPKMLGDFHGLHSSRAFTARGRRTSASADI